MAETIQQAKASILKVVDESLRQRALVILNQIANTDDLIWASEVEDGSVLIERIAADGKIGFSIEPDEKDSWYIVTKKGIVDYGLLAETTVSDLMLRFLQAGIMKFNGDLV